MKKLGFVIAACSLLAACGGSSPKVISATTAAATTATRITVGSSAPASTVVVTNTTPTTSAVVATTTTTTTTTTVPRTTTTAAPKLMPDLSGKTTTDAKEVLAALGVNDVRLGERENIAAPGTVLDQVPSKGSTITGPVDLTVSKALSPMPDFSGKLIADARDYFKQRGVTVTAADQLDDTKPEGTIVASTPAAGESIGSEVKLTVVKKPVTQFLAKTANVEQRGPCSFSSNDVGVNGATQLQSLLFGVQSTNYSCYIDFNLSRQWVRIKGGVGISDVSTSALQCRFEVFADTNPIYNQTVGLGAISPVDLDITNVLRLRIQVTETANGVGNCVWAGLRIIGSGVSS